MPEALTHFKQLVRNPSGQMELENIKQWFVIPRCTGNRSVFVFLLSADSAATLLFEWHPCHVAACLQNELSSTEEKL